MKVLFVNVIKDLPIQRVLYPLSFGYLVSYCNKQKVCFEHSYAEDLGTLKQVNPDVVAFSCITENFNLCKKYASQVKRFDSKIKTVIGGVHITAVPESLTEDFDVGIIGEGEQTFLELAKNGFEPSTKIDGLYFESAKTKERALIDPLDTIPYADRSIYGLGTRESHIFTSRGCSYHCKFCSSTRFWKKVRLHSAEYVAGELWELKRSGAKHITIYDDTFLLSLPRVKAISELVKDYGLSYSIAMRANQVSDEALEALKTMGVTKVGMGIESNSAKVLEWLEKGNTPEINQKAVDLLHKHGMPFLASFIRDTPVETEADLKATYDFIKRNNIEYDMYGLMPFPNTPIYDGRKDWDACKIRLYDRGVAFQLKAKARHIFSK